MLKWITESCENPQSLLHIGDFLIAGISYSVITICQKFTLKYTRTSVVPSTRQWDSYGPNQDHCGP